MRNVFIAATIVALFATPAAAQEMLVRDGADEVRITQKACPANVLQHVPPAGVDVFRKALVLFQGKEHIACWALRLDGLVHIVYSDGDQGLIPIRAFELVPDA